MNILCARTILLFAFTAVAFRLFAQPKINVLDSGHKVSIRGLSVVDDNVIWASGSNGTVAKSINCGKSFEWLKVKGYETRDFRDVEAFGADTALIMAVDVPALILKTYDGGNTWKEVFRDTTPGMFLDAMDFKEKHGVVIGDPVTNQPFFAYSNNYGDTWQTLNQNEKSVLPILDSGEAFFASSGTNVINTKFDSPYFGADLIVSGGKRSQLYPVGGRAEKSILLPLVQGRTSTGANSVAINGSDANLHDGVIVGGDFAHDQISDSNCALFQMQSGMYKISVPHTPPHGYRSCVIYLTKDKLITCGTSGVDISNDGGLNWQLISRQSFHVCQKAKKGNAVFLAGANGKIAAYR